MHTRPAVGFGFVRYRLAGGHQALEVKAAAVSGSALCLGRRPKVPETTASARPTPARPAPTQLGAVQPKPAAITRPPRNAPAAFARLNAEWFAAAASVGAPRATSMIRVWMIGTHAIPAPPIRKSVTAA